MKRIGVVVVVLGVVASIFVAAGQASAAGSTPIPVTPYSGFNSTLTRAPYVTDLTQTTAYVTWATTSQTPGSIKFVPTSGGGCPSATTTWSSTAKAVTTSLPGPTNPRTSGSTASMTGWAFSVTNGAGTVTKEYQNSVQLTGLSAGTQYCYSVFSANRSTAVDLLPAAQNFQVFTTLDAVSSGSSTPLTFDVLADTGENYASTSGTVSNDVAFPGGVNPYQAALYKLIGSSGAKFVLQAGDISYAGGNNSTYGDLTNTGGDPEVSNIFGPSYYPQTGGIPSFAATGNHGQNVTTLRTWPTPATAAASNGVYAFDSYSGEVDGISGTFPDDWYAFSTGNVRIYVVDASWSDGSAAPLGSTTGSLCSTGSYCQGYQADADEHFKTTSPEYQWLANDLSAHPGGVKFALFHYPLRSDTSTQPSDPYLLNSSVNPNASTSLEALLAANGVAMAFNGHAHNYQRFNPRQPGKQIVSYVVGGGGGVLEPVAGGVTCQGLLTTQDVYAIGWTPSPTDPMGGSGSYCGPATNQGPAAIAAATPQSSADVYSFLKVTVNGNTVTVTPTTSAGNTFDVQTYNLNPSVPDTVIDSQPPAHTSASTASFTFHATSAGATFACSLDGAAATGCTSPKSYSGLATGAHTFSVVATSSSGSDPTPATATWTVDPTATNGPTFVQATGATDSASSTTLTATLPAATRGGDLLVLSASVLTGATNNIKTVTDSGRNVWTKVSAYSASGHNSDGELWYTANASPASTVTVTTSSATFKAIEVQEFSGVATTAALDATAGSSNTGTAASSGSATVGAGDLIVGFIAGHGNGETITVTTSPSYTLQRQLASTGSIASLITGYQLATAATAGIAGSFPSAMYWSAGIAAFKPAS